MTASALHSVVSGSGIATGVYVGMANTVIVTSKDTNGFAQHLGGENFYLKIDIPATYTLMTDNLNGSYTATYTANTIGTINVSVWV